MAQKMYSEIQLDLEIKGYIAAIEKAKQANAKLKSDYEAKVNKMKAKSDDLMAKFRKIAGVLGVTFGVQQLISFGKELFDISAKTEGVKAAFERLDNPALLANLRTATRGTVSDLKLMTAAVQANNFKISLEQLPTYFNFAQQRARATGESVDYLVESIIKGIGRKSALVLDNLGISLVELNKQLEKTPDYAEAVGAIIQREMKLAGDYTNSAADSADRYRASVENFKASFADSGFTERMAIGLENASQIMKVAQADYFGFWKKLWIILYKDWDQLDKILKKQQEINNEAAKTPPGYNPLLNGGVAGSLGIGTGFSMVGGIKPTTTEPPAATGQEAKDLVFGPGYWQAQVEAAAEWNTFAEEKQKAWEELLKTSQQMSLSQVEGMNKLVEITNLAGTAMYDYAAAVEQMSGAISSLFRSGMEGWKSFGETAKRIMQEMLIKVLTLITMYTILNLLSGGTFSLSGLGAYIQKGFGITPLAPAGGGVGSVGPQELVVRGTSLATVTNRGSNIIYKNT
jgi:hypothetical protein